MQNTESFGDIITRKTHDQGYTLRSLTLKLKGKGLNIDSVKVSKIMRGIQNPSNKDEFDAIMDVLNIPQDERIELEKMANNFIPVKELTDKEILQRMPLFIGREFKNEEELDEFYKNWTQIIKQGQEPEK